MPIRILPAAVAILLLLLSAPAAANGMPASWGGDVAGPIIPAAGTPVGIDAEELTVVFTAGQVLFQPLRLQAAVTAVYTLDNPAPETLTVPVLFLGYLAGPGQVTLDGSAVAIPAYETDNNPAAALPSAPGEFRWYDPWTGALYPLPRFVSQRNPGVIPFTLELPHGRHTLQVSFPHYLGYDGMRYPNHIYHLTYLLQPARYWAYCRNLQISVRLPAGGYRVAASLPLQKDAGNLWAASFPELPPQDLHLSVLPTAGMWLGRYTSRAAVWLLLLVSLLLPAAVRKRLRPGRLALAAELALRGAAAWFAWDTLTRGFLAYPLNILVQAPALVFTLLWLLYGAGKSLWACRRAFPGMENSNR